MKRGKFVVIEGPDGVGKTTQIRLLTAYLKRHSIKFHFIHFPRYKKNPYGRIISMYLRGDFGNADEVNPYLASLLYAFDRKQADKEIREAIKQGIHIIADRHYLSNLAYQSVKIIDAKEKDIFVKWLNEVEFKYNGILKPNIYIYLDAPLDFVLYQNSRLRLGKERDYLSKGRDIHEIDKGFQSRVYDEYKSLALNNREIKIIKCYDENGSMLKPIEINRIVIKELQNKRIL